MTCLVIRGIPLPPCAPVRQGQGGSGGGWGRPWLWSTRVIHQAHMPQMMQLLCRLEQRRFFRFRAPFITASRLQAYERRLAVI